VFFYTNFFLSPSQVLPYIARHTLEKQGKLTDVAAFGSIPRFGRPVWKRELMAISERHPGVKKIGIFACGPRGMSRELESVSRQISSSTSAFDFHEEVFN
jgi:hypothetical protein